MGVIRRTKAVNTLLTLFEEKEGAVSVVDLIEELKTEMNKTTVYRVLDRLEQDGFIHSFNGKDALKWYARCKSCTTTSHFDKHPHFQCLQCGKMECLSIDIVIPTLENHTIESQEILLVGRCDECDVTME